MNHPYIIQQFCRIGLLALTLQFIPCAISQEETAPVSEYRIVQTYPHNQTSYTQGLIFDQGFFYEGTGRLGYSKLLKIVPETGIILREYRLENQYFGEGITLFQNRIIQLTWESNLGFVYDKETFNLIEEFRYPTEGWGLTHNGEQLIMSNGTATLYFLNPDTFEEMRRVTVIDGPLPIHKLNELEWIEGEIFANIWEEDRIARIDPSNGRVTGWLDMSDLRAQGNIPNTAEVLNGIAYDTEGKRLFVTGKLWPKLFEIEIIPNTQSQSSGWRKYP